MTNPVNRNVAGLLAVLATTAAASAVAQDRLPTIPPAQYNDEQKQAAADFEAARKVPVFGPFEPLMHSPQLMTQARAMGDYLRYRSAIPNPLSEFTILLTAREWSQDYEWYVHHPIALKAGVRPEVAEAIAQGRTPEGLTEDEQIVHAYVTELLKNRQVSEKTFERAKARFGAKGVVDLGGTVGYYTLLAIELNAAQYPIPKDGRHLPRFPQ